MVMPFPFSRGLRHRERAGDLAPARHPDADDGADTVAGLRRPLTGFSIDPWSLRPRHPSRSSIDGSILTPAAQSSAGNPPVMADADNRRVDDLSVGRLITLARQRRQWRQVDLAVSAGVSQQLVALAESGAMDRLTLRSLRGIAKPLGMRVVLTAVLNGGDADRLRDRDHASLVERITSMLRRHEWEVIVEYTFSHYGERGSIDIVAWHGDAHALLVIEVKTRIYDVQALLAVLDRKARVAGRLLAEERGWTPSTVGRVTVVPELSANRSVAERHASLFRAALPARSREVRTWLRRSAGALAGLWFLSSTNEVGGIRVAVGRQRVRVRGQARRGGQVTRSTSRVG